MSRISLQIIVATFVVFVAGTASAACTLPTGVEGETLYNTDYATMQFCDGTNWISMAASGSITAEVDPQVGTLTATKWCKANAGATAIDCGVTSINLASDVTGLLPIANISATGTASATTYLRGDGSWTTPSTSQWNNGTGGVISYSGGNIGIGSATPVAALDVVGNVVASGTVSGAAPTTANHLTTKAYVDAAVAAAAGLSHMTEQFEQEIVIPAGAF